MAYIYDLSDTWNAGGTTFYGIKMNVTNTASAAGSRLLSVQVGSVEQAWIGPTGSAYFAGNVACGNITVRGDATEGGQISLNNKANTTVSYSFDIDASDNGRLFTIVNNTSLLIGQLAGTGGVVSFHTAGSERMRIDANGNVGIGITSPTQKAHVQGNVLIIPTAGWSSGQVANLYLGDANNGFSATNGGYVSANSFNGYTFIVNNTEAMRINESRNVGIGTTSPSCLLDVNANKMRLRTSFTPASASAAGNAGDICWDSSYIYICTATNTWKRAALSTW